MGMSHWVSRNRFLALALMFWGVINFVCFAYRSDIKYNSHYEEVWCAGSFFCMFGAGMTLALLSLDKVNDCLKICVMVILFVGGLLLIAAASIAVDKGIAPNKSRWFQGRRQLPCGNIARGLDDEGRDFGSNTFGTSVLVPCLTAWSIAFDLWKRHLQKQQWRLMTYSGILILSAVLVFIYYAEREWVALSLSNQVFVIGFIFLFIGSVSVFVVQGGLQIGRGGPFNFFCAFMMAVGMSLLLFCNEIRHAEYVVWWQLSFAIAHLLAIEVKEQATVTVRDETPTILIHKDRVSEKYRSANSWSFQGKNKNEDVQLDKKQTTLQAPAGNKRGSLQWW